MKRKYGRRRGNRSRGRGGKSFLVARGGIRL